MNQIITRLEQWLLMTLNGAVSASPTTFAQALTITDRTPWVILALILAMLWFTGTPGALQTERGMLTRFESRRRVMLLVPAMLLSVLCAQWIGSAVFRPHPIVDESVIISVPLQPEVLRSLRGQWDGQSAFPAQTAAAFMVVVTGLFSINIRAGVLGTLVHMGFCALWIGTGQHGLIDLLAGSLLGILAGCIALLGVPLLRRPLTFLALQFEHRPALMHLIGFVILFDVYQKFAGVMSMLQGVTDAVRRL
jgi:hypothetical protein